MSDALKTLASVGVGIPDILLPAPGIDPSSWAVVACDQYSSERGYWESVKRLAGDAPSTLNLIFPECYLEDGDGADRIESIQRSMRSYLERGYLRSPGPGFILVERHTPFSSDPRLGLVMAVDLEQYRYGADSRSLIRPTEGTIVERLPPRIRIRRGAPLELPHIMLLADDPEGTVIEHLHGLRDRLPVVYDFDLMHGAGHLKGWRVSDPEHVDAVARALAKLADPETFRARYGTGDVLLFAVGDGNHSLATAKAVWEEIKEANASRPDLLARHPARYALVELVNIHDRGLPFHPIHRVLFGAETRDFLAAVARAGGTVLAREARGEDRVRHMFAGIDGRTDRCGTAAEARKEGAVPGEHRVGYLDADRVGTIVFSRPSANLAAGTLQDILDPWLAAHPGTTVDYIHGSESLAALSAQPGCIGLYMPPVDKAGFFRTVIRDGVMPRKTFSMGEAPEKRFYMESRLILPD